MENDEAVSFLFQRLIELEDALRKIRDMESCLIADAKEIAKDVLENA